jgi:hypothetical protein
MDLKASQLKTHRENRVYKNHNLCELCGLPFGPGQAVLDHQHHGEGLVRGAIHRSCNTILGKLENGFRYGKGFDPIAFAAGVHKYLTKDHGDLVHPAHNRAKKRRQRKPST